MDDARQSATFSIVFSIIPTFLLPSWTPSTGRRSKRWTRERRRKKAEIPPETVGNVAASLHI